MVLCYRIVLRLQENHSSRVNLAKIWGARADPILLYQRVQITVMDVIACYISGNPHSQSPDSTWGAFMELVAILLRSIL